MVDGFETWLGESLAFIQLAAAMTVPIFWLWYYQSFASALFRFATRYVGLTAVVAVLYLMVYGLLGADLGIPYLFWHDDFWRGPVQRPVQRCCWPWWGLSPITLTHIRGRPAGRLPGSSSRTIGRRKNIDGGDTSRSR